MRLEWTQLAVSDREAVFQYIEMDSPKAAARIDALIAAQVQLLISAPEMGRLGRVAGTRELVIQRTPYLAVYQTSNDRLLVLRILYGAQLWPEAFEDAPSS